MHLLLNIQLLLYHPLNLFLRLFAMFHLCETSFWRRRTTRGSAGHLEISCSFWCRGLANLCASFGIPETSRPTFLHTRCCRLWCSAARRTSKLPSKVMPWATSLYCLCYIYVGWVQGKLVTKAQISHKFSLLVISRISRVPMLNVAFALLLTIVLPVFTCCYSCYYI